IITSNNEKELPDAFLRRCLFHYIEFPDEMMMEQIVRVHHPNVEAKLLREVLKKFYWIRSIDMLRKKPSTSELIDWVQALMAGGMDPGMVRREIPFLGTLLKKEQDLNILLAQEVPY
ncbi:MAG TPA: MoxR family ATPase, partial [Synergistaceae bacterium]|nr:MoxR family ATPase [Synergistaceae bacterium]